MRTRLRQGLRLAAVTVVALAPVLSGSDVPVVDVAPRTTAGGVVAGALPDEPDLPGKESARTPLPPPQQIEPQTTLVAKSDRARRIRVDGPRGSRVWTASALASHDLPQAALAAYQRAAATMAGLDPGCQMPWTLLAGIGRVESDHGRYGGSVLSTDGVSRPAIIGVALDGRGPVAAIRDSDGGRLDGDKVWDRAVGPMQFIPTTWDYAGRDGDGDGRLNPHDLDDAALAAASYLCAGSGSMLDDAAARAAIFRYNPSDFYVALVQAFEAGYRTGVFVMPSPPPPSGTGRDRPRRTKDRDGAGWSGTSQQSPSAKPKPGSSPDPKPSSDPSPKPGPSPTPKPSPSPSPSTPVLEGLSGTLVTCGDGWCVGERTLDLGPPTQLSKAAGHDYDGDGGVETNSEELAGLVGSSVQLQVATGTGTAVVYVLQGQDYRFADGTFS